MRPVRLRFQDSVQVAETAERLFARLDDQGFLIVTDKFPETLLAFVPR